MNFATLKGLTIPEGAVTQITDASGRVLWKVSVGSIAVLGVNKITADTRAGETDYTGEEFVLLDIYPKTNGTVSVTYGGLTKTITDTSGVAEPNAQQVFFGTFNGVSDGVSTPSSGELVIEGAFYAFGVGSYSVAAKGTTSRCPCITYVEELVGVTAIPDYAFYNCQSLTYIPIPDGVETIGDEAFCLVKFVDFVLPASVKWIGVIAFSSTDLVTFVSHATTPPTIKDGSNIFNLSTKLTTITVPKGCGEAYKAAAGWNLHADKIVEAL